MLRGLDLRALFDRLQGTAATALALLLIALVFVYLVPRQGEIAAAMDARWERARIARETTLPATMEPSEPSGTPNVTVEPSSPSPSATQPPVEEPPQQSVTASPETQAASEPLSTTQDGLKLLSRPVAIDTATIMIRRGKVRLVGVQPVPMARTCGEGTNTWFCGVESRTRFRSWLLARSISCQVPAGFGERVETVDASCTLAGEDIGRWLVRNGWAQAVRGGPYAADEARARDAKLGVWSDHRLGG